MAVEFIECGSLSISYDATGKASVGLSVIKDSLNNLTDDYNNRYWGKVHFDLVTVAASQKALLGSGGWAQWSLQMEGVGD